ncbi:MAG: glycosyltransferase family 2 protein, partial [Dehalococcoidia bacterium]
RVVRETRPGYGAALIKGFSEAKGRYLVMGDCDGTYDFSRLSDLVGPLDDDGVEMVVGNRLTSELAPGAMPWPHQFLGTPLISWVVRIFGGAHITDSQCGLRSIRKDSYESLRLKSTGMEFASEMILKAMRNGLVLREVDIPYNVRTGESKLSTFRDGWRHLRFLLMSSPSYVFVVPALVLLVIGAASLGVSIFTTNGVTIGDVRWEPIFAGSVFLVIGMNLLMLGLISKIFAAREAGIEDSMVVFYRRYLGLERLLLLSILMILGGIIVDGIVFVEWATDSGADLLPWATVGQTLLIMGTGLGFGAIAAGMIEYEQ